MPTRLGKCARMSAVRAQHHRRQRAHRIKEAGRATDPVYVVTIVPIDASEPSGSRRAPHQFAAKKSSGQSLQCENENLAPSLTPLGQVVLVGHRSGFAQKSGEHVEQALVR